MKSPALGYKSMFRNIPSSGDPTHYTFMWELEQTQKILGPGGVGAEVPISQLVQRPLIGERG